MWQDYVVTIGSVIFIVALIPSIISKDKPALMTSLMTGLILILFTITYFSLDMLGAALTNGILSILWLLLAWQKYNSQYKIKETK